MAQHTHPLKITIFFLLINIGISCTSCFSEATVDDTIVTSIQKNWESLEQLNIAITPPQQSFYRLARISKDDRILAYNPGAHSFDVYEIENSSTSRTILLAATGPNSVEEVRDFYLMPNDSIVCFGRNNIKVIGVDGKVGRTLNLAAGELTGIDQSRYQVSVKAEGGIAAGVVNDKLYVPIHNYEHSDYNEPARYNVDVPLVGQLDLKTGHLTEQIIRYPARFREDVYGFGSQPQFAYTPKEIIYSFTGFPEIYVFDPKSEQTRTISGTIPGAPATPSALNQPPEIHIRQVIQYTNAVYDVTENAVYQGILYPKVLDQPRKLLLRKVDLGTGKQIHTDFPKRHSFIGMFVDSKGRLVLPNMNGEEDILAFTLGDIE